MKRPPITVVGLSTKESAQSLLEQKQAIYIKLSAVPLSEWTEIYSSYRSNRNHQLRFESRVSGDWIVVRCNHHDFSQRDLDELKFDVQQVNCLWEASENYKKICKENELQKELDAQKRVSELENRLRF